MMVDKIYSTPIRRLYDIQVGNLPEEETPAVTFSNFLKDAIGKLNDAQLQADGAINSFLKGEDIDIHNVMITLQKAEMSLNLAMQLRNKVVEVYQEIMRMQI